MISYRMWVPRRKGRSLLHLKSRSITRRSVVHISACEASNLDKDVFRGTQAWWSFIGSASITVQNICVRDGVVDFYVNVDWRTPLNLTLDITVLDPPAEFIVGS